jgi:hypothetical protein
MISVAGSAIYRSIKALESRFEQVGFCLISLLFLGLEPLPFGRKAFIS